MDRFNPPTISFEFFPPKTEAAEHALWAAIPDLAALDPKFMTVTYGAGGSTRDKTLEIIAALRAKTSVPIAMHLTFINTDKKDLFSLTDTLWEQGTRHLVALRGDMPTDLSWPLNPDGDYFQYTSDFVEALLKRHPFEVSVSAYPEKHPDSGSLADDISALKKKCEAGATRAITQFFFENEKFYDFVEQCEAAGVKTPICPGLLPIHDFKAMTRFAARCQASVPTWLADKFAKVEDKPDDARKLATDLLTEQALDLAQNGVEHVHFYTLNKSGITREVCEALSG
ncbi:MAG: methylenetetrahydrofolate reductase [NAD(P)H] [Alphaproteobacteria bacterium]